MAFLCISMDLLQEPPKRSKQIPYIDSPNSASLIRNKPNQPLNKSKYYGFAMKNWNVTVKFSGEMECSTC